MLGVLGLLLGAGIAVGVASGVATYELFAHILPPETGVPLGCVFGTIVGFVAAGSTFVLIGQGIEWP